MTEHCLLVNPLCPDDLCVLPRNHPGTKKNEHLLGTMYGSAGLNPSPKYRLKMSRHMFLAPEGSTEDDLMELGCKRAEELWPSELR